MASIDTSPNQNYVEHLDRNARVDAITAEDVMREYQSAAKEVEAMGAELVSVAKKCEAMTANVRNAISDIAEAYRQQGKKISGRIDGCVLLNLDVRKTCEDLKHRIGAIGDVQ